MQDFYEDLFEELSKYGEIENLNICDNLADHMVCPLLYMNFAIVICSHLTWVILCLFPQVGNVYVQFREEDHAASALQNLTGRFYAG